MVIYWMALLLPTATTPDNTFLPWTILIVCLHCDCQELSWVSAQRRRISWVPWQHRFMSIAC